jgi:hypothetical protein
MLEKYLTCKAAEMILKTLRSRLNAVEAEQQTEMGVHRYFEDEI